MSQPRRTAGVLLVLAWMLWFHRWVPALLVAAFVVWVILHHRLEVDLGEMVLRRWRRIWPSGPLVLIPLLFGSALAFVLDDAPAKVKILPVGLDVLAFSMILFGNRWTVVVLPRWLGGPDVGTSPVREETRLGHDAGRAGTREQGGPGMLQVGDGEPVRVTFK